MPPRIFHLHKVPVWSFLMAVGLAVFLLFFAYGKAFAADGYCGDGTLQLGEDCDAGDQNGKEGSTCTIACTHLFLECINKESCGCFDAFQPALFTVGQTSPDGSLQDPHGYLPNNGGYPTNARGFDRPSDIAVDQKYRLLYVADRMNNRVLVFQLDGSMMLVDQEADFVLGQPDFTSKAAGGGQTGMRLPSGIAVDSLQNRLFVSDSGNNRVLVYSNVTPLALSKGLIPTAVLGQRDFSSVSPALSSSRMNHPGGLDVTTRGDVYVADTGNHRVLRFHLERGLSSGQLAETVLGQKNFTEATASTTLAGMRAPRDVMIDPATQVVFVADTGNHRVLMFHERDVHALLQINDPNEAYRALNASRGADEKSLYGPESMSVSRDSLFVADTLNSRVLIFPLQEAIQEKGTSATAETLLGQDRFGANSPVSPPDLQYLLYPGAVDIALGNCTVFVADTGNNRISAFRPHGGSCTAPSQEPGTPFDSCDLDGVCEVSTNPLQATESCACEDCALNFCSMGTQCDAVTNACVPIKTAPRSLRSWIPSSFARFIGVVSIFLGV